MHRLFVAIRPPEPIRARLLDLMEGVSGARWQDEDQLHLTVRFLGEVGRHMAEDVAAGLANVRHPRFELALRGIGSFDRKGRAATLWAGVAPHKPLTSLHGKVDQACQRAGLEPERRAYLPHLTLARLGRSAGSIRHLVEGSGALTSPPFQVDSFGLFESSLAPGGAVYTLVERYPLG